VGLRNVMHLVDIVLFRAVVVVLRHCCLYMLWMEGRRKRK
jgi:hypothetical protein